MDATTKTTTKTTTKATTKIFEQIINTPYISRHILSEIVGIFLLNTDIIHYVIHPQYIPA
jgi:hypothetical protein